MKLRADLVMKGCYKHTHWVCEGLRCLGAWERTRENQITFSAAVVPGAGTPGRGGPWLSPDEITCLLAVVDTPERAAQGTARDVRVVRSDLFVQPGMRVEAARCAIVAGLSDNDRLL